MSQNNPNQYGDFPNNSGQSPAANNPDSSLNPGAPGGQFHQIQPYQPQPGSQSPIPPAPNSGNYQWNSSGQPQGQPFPQAPVTTSNIRLFLGSRLRAWPLLCRIPFLGSTRIKSQKWQPVCSVFSWAV